MKIKTAFHFGVMIVIFTTLIHCGNQANQTESGVVVWSELSVLDELSESVILNDSQNQSVALREVAGMLFNAGRLVVNTQPPANAKQLEQVKLLQNDLQGLINDEPENLTDEELIERVNAIHAIAVKLMETAGMPHVHNHDEHNHDEHNHDEHNHNDQDNHEGHKH